MSDSQYDLTLALLDPAELDAWSDIVKAARVRALHEGQSTDDCDRHLHCIAVELERRELEGAYGNG